MCDPRREMLKQTLRSLFEQTIDDRVDRYLSVNHQSIIGSHHFAPASAECIRAYRDGNFTLCVMGTQAVNDGIIKFVAERNEVPRLQKENNQELAERLRLRGIVSPDFVPLSPTNAMISPASAFETISCLLACITTILETRSLSWWVEL